MLIAPSIPFGEDTASTSATRSGGERLQHFLGRSQSTGPGPGSESDGVPKLLIRILLRRGLRADMTSFLPRGFRGEMEKAARSVYAFSAPLLDGSSVRLEEFKGRVLLIVNTASKCGFTPQYAGLEQLYRTYKDRGFAVLGFPCNQFGHAGAGHRRGDRHVLPVQLRRQFSHVREDRSEWAVPPILCIGF